MKNFYQVNFSAYDSRTSQSFCGLMTMGGEFKEMCDAKLFQSAEAAIDAARDAVKKIRQEDTYFGKRIVTAVEIFVDENDEVAEKEIFKEEI